MSARAFAGLYSLCVPKGRAAHNDFFMLRKDADTDTDTDTDIPILIAAKAEYAKLKKFRCSKF